MSRADIIEELFKPSLKNFKRRPVSLRGINDLIQVDLAEFQKLSKENRGIKFLLVGINCFTKKAFAEPIKNKTAKTVAEAMKKILLRSRTRFRNLQSDKGSEFKGDFARLMESEKINHYSTHTDKKASIVERFLRTLKNNLYKRMALESTHRYTDFLQDVVDDYNNRVHSTTKLKPSEITKRKHEKHLLATVYKKNNTREVAKAVRFRVGDVVRISTQKRFFAKSYDQSWSSELFKVTAVNRKIPTTYKLSNYFGDEDIIGSFYEQELQKTKNDDLFLIEKIIQKRGKKVLVRFAGYGKERDTWIDKASITT